MAIPFHDRRTGEVIYHGTSSVLSPGDVVVPGAKSGKTNWVKDDSVAYATNDLGAATYFANESANNESEALQKRVEPKIYRVSPVDASDTSSRTMRDMRSYAAGDETPVEVSSKSGFKVEEEVPTESHPDLTELMMKNMLGRRQ